MQRANPNDVYLEREVLYGVTTLFGLRKVKYSKWNFSELFIFAGPLILFPFPQRQQMALNRQRQPLENPPATDHLR